MLWTISGAVQARAVPAPGNDLMVNPVLMWMKGPHANRNEKAVLAIVAHTYRQCCMAGVTSGQLSSVQALPDANWQEGGSWQLGTLKLEWGEAFTVAASLATGCLCPGLPVRFAAASEEQSVNPA